jgi:XTP/dITP diphosphohydrolase
MGQLTDRRARFVSTLVALRHARDPEPLIAFGRWELELLHEPRGSGGFGYDPVVLVPTHGCSVAQLDAGVKNRISHRALAARQLRVLMQQVWRLG